MTNTALNALRQYLDDLPPWTVFIGTTNKKVHELAEPLQTRFQVWKFELVPVDQVEQHLIEKFNLDAEKAKVIARNTHGCVRAAEEDAQMEADVQAMQQLA